MRVETESATYEVGPEREWIVRHPAGTPGDWPVAVLRKDTERIPVLGWTEPVVGESWVLVLDVRGDGASTVRATTPVRSIAD